MRIQFELGKEDLVAYNLYHHSHSPTTRGQKRKGSVNIVLLGLMFWVGPVILAGPSKEHALALSPFLLIIPLGLAIFAWRWPVMLRRNIERMISEGENRGLVGKKEVTITPVEITAAGDLTSVTVRWKAVERIEVAQDCAYLYFSALGAFIVPRRAFSSDAGFAAWVETARKYRADALR